MPLRSLGMWIGQAQRATASGERIFQVIDEPEEVADRPGAGELPAGRRRASASKDVGFEYMPGRPVLEGIDLDVPARSDDRADRTHGLGQDDADLARAALLRRHRRPRARSTAPTCGT